MFMLLYFIALPFLNLIIKEDAEEHNIPSITEKVAQRIGYSPTEPIEKRRRIMSLRIMRYASTRF